MTETSKTRVQLCNMALDELRAIGAGQSPEAEDTEYVDGRFDGLMGELSRRGIFTLADENEIEIELTGPLAQLLANECANKFQKPKLSYAERTDIEDRIRTMQEAIQSVPTTLKVDPALSCGPIGLSLARWTRGG